ncbi:hypothetical protein OG792_04145 [Micromonospora sp. NBC_01699]|uniref:hypothetical protein n=1 Tax=Micromonospora sp. NBC_01699 TaxID=2975984 RepID=UPI002E27C202|nr:hypothetical protein [Micromonospora sp. NBC_01699]
MILRRAFGALLALVTFGTVLVGAAAPSQAAVACSGTITYSYAWPVSNPVAELVIYYNSSNGGTNSACMYHRGTANGVSVRTSVQITRCAETSGAGSGTCTATAVSSKDEGSYAYYAGPRGVTGTANNCVNAYGEIDWADSTYWIRSGRQGC